MTIKLSSLNGSGVQQLVGSIDEISTTTLSANLQGLVFSFDAGNPLCYNVVGSTTTFADISGGNFSLKVPTTTAGLPAFSTAGGGSLNFTAGNAGVVIPSTNQVLGDFTVETWCQTTGVGIGGAGPDNCPVAGAGWTVWWTRPGYLGGWAMNTSYGGGAYSTSLLVGYGPNANQWNHVTAQKYNSGTWQVFTMWINGINRGSNAYANYNLGNYWINTSTSVGTTSIGQYFNGLVSTVRVWNRKLSDVEVKANFNSTVARYGFVSTATITGVVSTSTIIQKIAQGPVMARLFDETGMQDSPFAIARATVTGTVMAAGGFDEVFLEQTTAGQTDLWLDARSYYAPSGAKWPDLGPNNYTVTVDQNPQTEASPSATNVVTFNGTSTSATVLNAPVWAYGEFSIEVWCRLNSVANSNTGVWNSVLYGYDTIGNTWYLTYNVPGYSGERWKLVSNLMFQGSADMRTGYTVLGSTPVYGNEKWRHIVVTRDNVGLAGTVYRWYENGVLTSSTNFVDPGGHGVPFNVTTSTIIIGSTASVSVGLVRTYNYGLTSTEVTALFETSRASYGI